MLKLVGIAMVAVSLLVITSGTVTVHTAGIGFLGMVLAVVDTFGRG